MCCVFTCCGWMIDLLQRLWTFTMSCCISSAVCCSLLAASMSGIAMGYNYSLAEYIDLKETNVSVYLKRGVFDDEISSDVEFRRSGNEPAAANLVTVGSGEETLLPKSGRRLDDSVLQSNEQHSFEGSLMRLTAKPPDATQSTTGVSSDENMGEIIQKYPSGSIDQLKAIQSLINMRKANENRATKHYDQTTTSDRNVIILPEGRRMMVEPDTPQKHNIYVGNKAIPYEQSSFKINPARLAVPDEGVVEAANWFLPNEIPNSYKRTMFTEDYDNIQNTGHTYPSPIRYKTGANRPTVTRSIVKPTLTALRNKENLIEKETDTRRLENSELNRIQNNLLLDKAKFPSFRKPLRKPQDEKDSKSDELDYEEEAMKGLPVRRKRSLNVLKDTPLPKGLNQNEPTVVSLSNTKHTNNRSETEHPSENISKMEQLSNINNIYYTQMALPSGAIAHWYKKFLV